MKQIFAETPAWSGSLILSENSDIIFHEQHKTSGRYYLSNDFLTIAWDMFGVEQFQLEGEIFRLVEPENDSPKPSSCIVHFVYFSQTADDLEISIPMYLALKSAFVTNPNYRIFLHTNANFSGILWKDIENKIEINKCSAPSMVFGKEINKIQHKADVKRLEVILHFGGIYLDTDTICLRSFDPLLKKHAVMGMEGNYGLCNAVIIAPQSSKFISIWRQKYENFHNEQWNEFSVVLPYKLSREFPDLISIEPEASFFYPSFNAKSLRELFIGHREFSNAYIFHIWGSVSKNYVEFISFKHIFSFNSSYNNAARNILLLGNCGDLPFEYDKSRTEQLISKKEIFVDQFEQNGGGYGFGKGSYPANTTGYRSYVEKFIFENDVNSIVEIGCGNYAIFEKIYCHDATYVGLDIIPELIEQNKRNFQRPGVSFQLMPEQAEGLPHADLLVIKSVLQHLDNQTIIAFRDQIIPKYRFCLITNSLNTQGHSTNMDIQSGDFRPLNLVEAPYLFSGTVVHSDWNEWEKISTILIRN
ncbi:glycosyltransferase [Acidocella sp.]|uniref:glycosyltransferase n=1 Tax=Acidocella sp. TaxID=50710 RepID=UPI002627D020|nr:glycosyltransferase [Acidocella sp.]